MAEGTKKNNPAVFTKEQLVKSKKYMPYADFLNGNLKDGMMYTIEQIEKLISKSYGRGE